jgi:hypothetical protein
VSDIFQEVDEDLRRDAALKLWKKYRGLVVALGVVIVAASGGYSWWRYHDEQARQSEETRYAAALDLARAGKSPEAAEAMTALVSQAHAGRAMLARFEAAALKAKAGDAAGAVAAYDALAKDPGIDEVYRGLATVLWGLQALEVETPQAVIDRMAPLTDAANPWHLSAIEVTAIAHLKAGDRAAARSDYQRLADDLSAPSSLRARAAEVAAALAS